MISAARTAASAVLAASHLRSGDHHVGTFGIVGTGLIARYVLRFLVGTSGRSTPLRCSMSIPPAPSVSDSARALQPNIDVRHRVGHANPAEDERPGAVCDGGVPPACPRPAASRASTGRSAHLSRATLPPRSLVDAFNIVDDMDHVMREDTSLHLTEQLTGTERVRCRLARCGHHRAMRG